MRTLTAACLAGIMATFAATLPSTIAAQPHASGFRTVTAAGQLFRISATGTTSSMLASISTASHGVTMAFDNDAIYWTGLGSTVASVAGTINQWQGAANTTILSTTDFLIAEVLQNQNAEIVFTGEDTSRSPSLPGLFKWNGGTAISTIVTTAGLGQPMLALDGGLEINIDTGNYLVAAGAFVNPGQLFDVADDGTVTRLITVGSPDAGRYTVTQDRKTGAIYQSGFADYRVVQNGVQRLLAPTGGPAPGRFYAIRVDRASTPDTARFLYGINQSSNATEAYLHRIADPNGTPSYTSTALQVSSGPTTGMVFDGERNIASARTGPGAYDVDISFPGEAGRRYVVALSGVGYVPGFTTNGLHVALAVDALTVLSIQNLLRPLFDAGPGTLDAQGRARGSIALGRNDIGVRVWMVAATLTGGTVTTVSSPFVLRL